MQLASRSFACKERGVAIQTIAFLNDNYHHFPTNVPFLHALTRTQAVHHSVDFHAADVNCVLRNIQKVVLYAPFSMPKSIKTSKQKNNVVVFFKAW